MSIISLLRQTLFSRKPGSVATADRSLPSLPSSNTAQPDHSLTEPNKKKVLNVGGNSKAIAIPDFYDGWTHHLLDIDPTGQPDVVCDARTLVDLPGHVYDSVYCSHNLEHYYSHDVVKVLTGFHHVLKSDGFVNIAVPDMLAVMKQVVQNDMDIEDVLYESPSGPIKVKDVFYGLSRQIEQSGVEFFAHKTGFSESSLIAALKKCGFNTVYSKLVYLEIKAFAFKQQPGESFLMELGLSSSPQAIDISSSIATAH